MKQRYYLLLWALLATFILSPTTNVMAQRGDIQEWAKGRIILTSGDTLYGPIAYHRTEDIIRVTLSDGSINAFAPVAVNSFTVTDEKNKYVQTFRPFLWNRGNDYSDYQAPAFFELLTEGKYSLVKREILSARTVSNAYPMYAGSGRYYDPYAYTGSRYQTMVLDLFYLNTPNNKILALRNPKRDLEDLFKNKERMMREYIKANNLSYSETRDLIKILNHYNSLL